MGSAATNGTMPIAIIGLSCKFAGDASNPQKLWELLAEGRSAWSEIPSFRFNAKGAYHPEGERLSTMHVRGGHFLQEDIGLFDAAFFNYSGETAAVLDPQYRLQLESTYEALENAGLPLSSVAGSNTSVFAGTFSHDYKDSMTRDEDNLPRFLPIGTGQAMAANRVSHFFDFRGASMSLDTGCSTSFVALHQAVQSLRSGESDMSLVGASSVMSNPDMFKAMGSLGFLSPDGKSYAFDSRANGYGRGDGVATIVVKRLSDALAAGDPIRAVIRETTLNQDGKTETITSPSQSAQETLIRECYAKAGLDPRDTQYFEAHGTGTPTGDPIEARAIAAVFGEGRSSDSLLRIGSVKTNIGHTEPTSGLASLAKVILGLERGLIPPSINYKKPNSRLALGEWHLKVATELEQWPSLEAQDICRASINSFGYGGSNAHVIVEKGDSFCREGQYLSGTAHVDGAINGITGYERPNYKAKVFILSARDEQACHRMVSNLKEHLEQNRPADPEKYLQSLAYTLGQRRTSFPWVAAYPMPYTLGIDEVIHTLDSSKFAPAKTSQRPRIGMIFTGQGAQWHAMGRELIVAYPIFKASLDEAEGYLKQLGADWSLMEELCRDEDATRVNDTVLSIPICVALQISLVRLLRAWGVTPTAVTSHSSGEIAAAYTVGALDYHAAMAVAYHRAKLAATKSLRGPVKGSMVAVGVGLEEAEQYLHRLTGGGKAVIACVNSPSSVTMAGDLDAVIEIETMAKSDEVFARRLRVDTAYHSHHMSSLATPYREALDKFLLNKKPNGQDVIDPVGFSSPVTGGRIISGREIKDPEHWVGSLVQPVRFVDAFTDMVSGDCDPSGSSVDVIVEVGPHMALKGPVRQILELPEFNDIQLPYFGCLLRNTNARDSMQELAANLLRQGHPLNMDAVNFPWGNWNGVRVLTDLPPYPWNHQIRHWFEPRFNKAYREKDQPPHPLLGQVITGSDPHSPSWRHILRPAESPWIRDHVVQANMLYPAAGYICLAIEAIKQATNAEVGEDQGSSKSKAITGYRLRDVDILQALVVPDTSGGIEIQTCLRTTSGKTMGTRGWKRFEISSVTADNRWTKHATGLVSVDFATSKEPLSTSSATVTEMMAPMGCVRCIDPDDVYSSLRSMGVCHGPLFQQMKTISQSQTEPRSRCTFSIPDTTLANGLPSTHVVHPVTLDVVVQGAYTALSGIESLEGSAKIPKRINSLWVSSSISREAGHSLRGSHTLTRSDCQALTADVLITDDENPHSGPVLEINGLFYQSMGRSGDRQSSKPWEREVCNKFEWGPDLSLATADSLESIRQEMSHAMDVDESRLIMELRRVCIHFMTDALSSLTTQDVASLEGYRFKLHTWIQEQVTLAARGGLGLGSETWALDSKAERQLHMDKAAAGSINGEMVCHLGPHLSEILRGEKTALELMMERDKILYRYYGNALKSDRGFQDVAKLLRKVVHKNPRARILEIGGGTGGATRLCLEELGTRETGGPLFESYQFTDVSPGFFEAARDEFAAWADWLTFTKLDIEADPAEQEGIAAGSYDIVIACEVLHATKSMAKTMANVRKLLKPDGSLILLETTKDQLDMQFTFGLLPGWWLSEEPERRSSPSLSTPLWDQVLRGAGFTGVDLEIRDCETEDMYAFSTILSQVAPTQLCRRPSPDSVVIVTNSAAPPPREWVESLQRRIAFDTTPLPAVHTLEAFAAAVMGPNNSAVTTAYSAKICIFVGEVEQPILHDLDAQSLDGIRTMATTCKSLIWVTRGGAVRCEDPRFSLAPGFLRSLRNEYVGRQFVSLDLDPAPAAAWPDTAVSAITRVFNASFSNPDNAYVADLPPDEFEFAERAGVILIPRCVKDMDRSRTVYPDLVDHSSPHKNSRIAPLQQPDRVLSVHVGVPGLLDTLEFAVDTTTVPGSKEAASDVAPDLIEIEPRAYGVNFRDIMVAMNELDEHVMGPECAGFITSLGSNAAQLGYKTGDRVFCMRPGPSISTCVRVPWTSVMHMPPELGTFEEAASVPVIFSTAYMCLIDTARLQNGQSVLIHAAAGGVGQAAIMIAKHVGAEVFATVGTAEKKSMVMEKYDIPADHIFNSRDTSFASAVLSATRGRGVDVVLNSLAGPLLQESFNVLAPFGHFLEIGKRDLEQNSALEMRPFTRQVSFSSFDLLSIIRHKGSYTHHVLSELAQLFKAGVLKPVHQVSTYPISQISRAFRFLQAGKHIGKVVLSLDPNDMVPVRPNPRVARLSSKASYLIVGGAGGIGRSIASWMASRGARNLVLMSRNAGASEKAASLESDLRLIGCAVKAVSCDVSDGEDLVKALHKCEAEGLPPVRGVVQAAMLLQDSILEQMNFDDFRAGILPKVNASWNLHAQFQSVDFFIMLSSLAGIIGYASQSNYTAGGAYQDALARWRVSQGYPAVSIDLGAIKGVGHVAETAGVARRMAKIGHMLLPEDRMLRVIEGAMLDPFHPQVVVGLHTGPGSQWDRHGESQLGRDARFLAVRWQQGQHHERGKDSAGSGGGTLAGSLAEASSRDEAERLVGNLIAQKLADIFVIPCDEIDSAKHPSEYGVDSLVAVELRNLLAHQAAAEISIFGIMQSASLKVLASAVVGKSGHVPAGLLTA